LCKARQVPLYGAGPDIRVLRFANVRVPGLDNRRRPFRAGAARRA